MIDLKMGKSYWLIGYGKVWITALCRTQEDIPAFMARCQDVNKKDMGFRHNHEFEEIEPDAKS
jgi:hypothetical protein